MTTPRFVFAAGGTGHLGRRLIPALLARGHQVRALARPGSERIPRTRDAARRLGLVRLPAMVRALVAAVENPPAGVRVLEVPDIRAAASSGS